MISQTHADAVAEIAAGPGGPAVGAFFDFDGTLAAGFTGALLPWDRLRRGEMGIPEFLDTVWVALNYSLGRVAFEEFIRRGSMAFKGWHIDELAGIGERIYAADIAGRLYPEMRSLVQAHLDRGHTVVLSSAAFHLQLEPVARALGIEAVLCNWFDIDTDGVLTGEVRRPILRGAGKATAVTAFAGQHGVDLNSSYFYADGDEDIPLMQLVGNPRPTNPASGLAALAGDHGWPVLRFTSRSGNIPVARLRTGVAALALTPVALAAAGFAVLPGHRIPGAPPLASYWARALLAMTGVRLNITGVQRFPGPAVVLVNHRSAVDSVIVAAALGTHRGAPVAASLFTAQHAGDEDRAIADLVDRRLSVVAAAEGALLDGQDTAGIAVAPLRIAMAAGVPVVPVVIRNAETIAAATSAALHPGTVDVAVLPPIPVQHWMFDDVAAGARHIAGLYETTLRDWPTG